MAKKPTMTTIDNIRTSETVINDNFDTLAEAISDNLSRVSTDTNQMEQNLDMNGNQVRNVADATNNSDAATLGQVNNLIAGITQGGGDNTFDWSWSSVNQPYNLSDYFSLRDGSTTYKTTWAELAEKTGGDVTSDPVDPRILNLGTGVVETSHILDGTITGTDIGSNEVDTANLALDCITPNELAANAVEEAAIANSAVTPAKMADINYGELLIRTAAGAGPPQFSTINGLPAAASVAATTNILVDTGGIPAKATRDKLFTDADKTNFEGLGSVTTNRILGRDTAGTGDYEQLTPAAVGSMLGVAADQIITMQVVAPGTATTVANDLFHMRMPFAGTIQEIRAATETAGLGSDTTIRIRRDSGSGYATIFNTTELTIDASTSTSVGSASPYNLVSTALTDDDQLSVDITAISSGTAADGLVITLRVTPTI